MITCDNVSFSYPEVPVLKDVCLSVPTGEVTALFGPNGVGKSTLFRCILGELDCSGEICVDGASLHRLPGNELARRVGYVPQDHGATFPFTVRQMVLMGRQPHVKSWRGPSAHDEQVAHQAMVEMGIESLAERIYTQLSGGQRQMVLLARAIAQECEHLLLDEPTASLDFGNSLVVWEAIGKLADLGRAILVCTHDPNHVLWFTSRAVAMGRGGCVVRAGLSHEVLDQDLMDELYPGRGNLDRAAGQTMVTPHSMRTPALSPELIN